MLLSYESSEILDLPNIRWLRRPLSGINSNNRSNRGIICHVLWGGLMRRIDPFPANGNDCLDWHVLQALYRAYDRDWVW